MSVASSESFAEEEPTYGLRGGENTRDSLNGAAGNDSHSEASAC